MRREPGISLLVVDDEQAVRRLLRNSLPTHGYVVHDISSGEEVMSAMRAVRPSLIILDLGLPGMDGVEVTRLIREWSDVPILILSVRGEEADKVAALDAGADDYLTKPFGLGELLARMRVLLRRAPGGATDSVFSIGDLVVDLSRRAVTHRGNEVQLTPTEYEILRVLVRHAGKVITHRQMLQEVWGVTVGQDVHMLRVNMSNVRRKIEPDPSRPRYIVTEPGVGYRLRADR